MTSWSALDERVAHFWYTAERFRKDQRVLAHDIAAVMRAVAVTRRRAARAYVRRADHATGAKAMYLRSRARRLDDLATRAQRFLEQEHPQR